MSPLLSLLLYKIVLPDLILLLRKWGFFDAADALAAKTAVEIVAAIKQLKTYPEFPKDTSLRDSPGD